MCFLPVTFLESILEEKFLLMKIGKWCFCIFQAKNQLSSLSGSQVMIKIAIFLLFDECARPLEGALT